MVISPAGQQAPEAADANKPPRTSFVTKRAFALGLILALVFCAITPYNDYYVAATYLAGDFFPIDALVAVLLLVLVVNPLLIAFKLRRLTWSAAEVMTVWTMVLVVAGIPSGGLMRWLIPHIIAPHYYATVGNGWEGTVINHLPSYLLVNDKNAVRQFFEGLDRGNPIPWAAWVQPLAWWSVFVFFLFLSFFCLAALLRRQWAEHEKFSFPLVVLPVMLSEAPEDGEKFNGLLRSPLLWLAVIGVTVLHTIKGVHLFIPTLPDITTVWHSRDYLTQNPWSAINDIQFAIYPLVIGFAYLLSSEVSLSIWFFYLVFKLQVFYAAYHNFDTSSTGVAYSMGPSFVTYHEAGGVFMAVAWLLYAMRGHLKTIWRKAVFGDPDVDDNREPLSYRFAFFGAIVAVVGLYLWMTLAARIQPLMAFGLLVGALCAFILVSWLVAQAGLLFVTQTYSAAHLMTVLFGSAGFNAKSLAMGTMVEHIGWQDSRELMMPSLLNSAQAAESTRLSARSLTRALIICVVLATIVSAASSIWLPYTHGGGVSLKNPQTYIYAPRIPMRWTSNLVNNPSPFSPAALLHIGAGALFVLVLFLCRTYVPGFYLHPAGFLVSSSWAMYMLWSSLFLGWLIKAPILHYGGIKTYRLLLPFFLGLILGDCLNAIIWTIIGLLTHGSTGYLLLPN